MHALQAVAVVMISVFTATLITTRRYGSGRDHRRTVKDSVQDGVRVEPPTLQERKERAQRREDTPKRNSSETHPNDDRSDDEPTEDDSSSSIESLDSEFDWRTKTDVYFDDVGGMDELKQELKQDVLLPLQEDPDKAEELGVTPSNIVLHGPPGTGKTYMAKALATELGLPFVKLSGSDVQSKWINESAERVSTLFGEAREVADVAGGAVVFLDELDSVLEERTGAKNSHGEDVKVVNEFLNHLEESGKHDIVFIGATNRIESLDEAGVRSGRVDKKIRVGLPDAQAREGIIRAQLSDRAHAVSDDCVSRVASEMEGCSAADLAGVVDCAAREALAAGRGEMRDEDFDGCC